MQPSATDPAPVWQAWVESAASETQRDERLALVPEAIQARAAQHLRTVRSLEAYHRKLLHK
jgi:hypothetical protein